jgi:transcriptional regulator with XRE-family HTH domain
MTLADVIAKDFKGSQRAFAAAAGIDEGQLSKYLAAERGEPKGQRPSADNIFRIERATGGRITAAYWSELKQRSQGHRPLRPRHA